MVIFDWTILKIHHMNRAAHMVYVLHRLQVLVKRSIWSKPEKTNTCLALHHCKSKKYYIKYFHINMWDRLNKALLITGK